MSIDTENRRRSVICNLPVPDGTIDAADRAQIAWLYSGISFVVLVVIVPGKGHPKDAWVWGATWTPPEIDYSKVTADALRLAALTEMRTIDTMIGGLEQSQESEIKSIRDGTYNTVKSVLDSNLSERAYLEERRTKAKRIVDKPKLEALAKAREVRKANLDRKAAIKEQRLKNLEKARKAKKRKRKKK